ncbi:hypothetical protein PYCC9005_004711 [Savitreella phatthalungensis]
MSSPFIKRLAANDRPTRDAAVASLKQYLGSKRVFGEMDLLKLWKGLFYCFWHSDRAQVQHKLAQDLADLTLILTDENSLTWLSAFWQTMGRQWNSIDRWRLDKFYTLLRRFVNTAFKRLGQHGWRRVEVDAYVQLLESTTLDAKDIRQPLGVRYHIADIWIEELVNVLRSQRTPDSGKLTLLELAEDVPIDLLVRPFEIICATCPTKSFRDRCKVEVLNNNLLAGLRGHESKRDHEAKLDSDEESFVGFD